MCLSLWSATQAREHQPKGTVCKYEARPRKPKAVGFRLSVVFIIHQKSEFVKSRLEIFPKKLNQITKSDAFLFRKAYLTNKTEFLIEINSAVFYQEEQHATKQLSKHKNHITRFLNMLKTFAL